MLGPGFACISKVNKYDAILSQLNYLRTNLQSSLSLAETFVFVQWIQRGSLSQLAYIHRINKLDCFLLKLHNKLSN